MGNKVLIVGSGGREHALAWKMAQSPVVQKVVVLPGNAGMPLSSPKIQTLSLEGLEHEEIAHYCQHAGIDLVLIGPEALLAQGLADSLRRHGVVTLGPSQQAAQLEASKSFAKDFMQRQQIPTASSQLATSLAQARELVQAWPWPAGAVIKEDGLAGGKGVVVCPHQSEARAALQRWENGGAVRLVVEERLSGRELSIFYLCAGEKFISLGHACDYKRIGDGDQGPNTGGMGAYTPAPWVSASLQEQIEADILRPTLKGMQEEGCPFSGLLFLGLMVTESGPKVLEYNVRLGDPETQVLLPRIDADLFPLFLSWAKGEGQEDELAFGAESFVHVVKTAHGYPGGPGARVRKGDTLHFDPDSLASGPAQVFFANVTEAHGQYFTSGGRVVGLTGRGKTLEQARQQVYGHLATVQFAGEHFRTDIAAQEGQ